MKEFDALAAAVQKVALLEGYSDAGREEIDEAVSGLRETFVAFCNVSVIRDAVGTNVIEPVLVAIDEDTRRCGNCGNVDCDDEECDDT